MRRLVLIQWPLAGLYHDRKQIGVWSIDLGQDPVTPAAQLIEEIRTQEVA